VSHWLALDKRSLGLFRICLGLVLTLDVILRGIHFRAHYSSEGLFPLKFFLIQPDLSQRRWSFLFMGDTPLFVGLFFLFFLVCAVCLTLGVKTRWTGWLCWILILSVYRRNPVLNNGGDIYLPLMLLWGNFIPWGDRFSVDSRKGDEEQGELHHSLGGFCYLMQVAILYWFSAVLREGPEWQVDYSALYYGMHLGQINYPTADWMLLLGSDALAVITFLTIFLEAFGPFLLVVPSQWLRLIGVFLIVSFHLGILVTMFIPVFGSVCMVGPIGLLPGLFWDNRWGRRLQEAFERFFDSVRSRFPSSFLEAPQLPQRMRRLGGVYQATAVVALGLSIFYLYWGMPIERADQRNPLTGTLKALSLDQRWGMFSPHPANRTGYPSAPGRTRSGEVVDLFTWDEYSEALEDLPVAKEFWNYRWAAFHMSVEARREEHVPFYLEYLARRWDEAHPDNPIVAAQYRYHPHQVNQGYLLGDRDTIVVGEYHR